MSSEKHPVQPIPSLASATAKTQSVIEGLQARLSGEPTPRVNRHSASAAAARKRNVVELQEVEETEEELEQQLQTYFARTTVQGTPVPSVTKLSSRQVHDNLRERVIEGVVLRILAEWARHDQELPGGARLGNEIMERLIQRVLEQFQELAVA